ncbi:MAG: hypothetical protein ACFFCW_19965 [Candidatus Hodarchaeota archaeon]
MSKEIDITALQQKADGSEYKESFIVLEKSKNYRVGVSVRFLSPNQPYFFIEVLVYLCHNSSQVDLSLLEKKVTF